MGMSAMIVMATLEKDSKQIELPLPCIRSNQSYRPILLVTALGDFTQNLSKFNIILVVRLYFDSNAVQGPFQRIL